jgi:hypothetical protein
VRGQHIAYIGKLGDGSGAVAIQVARGKRVSVLRYDVSFMPALISTLPTEENTLAGAVLEAPSNAKGW